MLGWYLSWTISWHRKKVLAQSLVLSLAILQRGVVYQQDSLTKLHINFKTAVNMELPGKVLAILNRISYQGKINTHHRSWDKVCNTLMGFWYGMRFKSYPWISRTNKSNKSKIAGSEPNQVEFCFKLDRTYKRIPPYLKNGFK